MVLGEQGEATKAAGFFAGVDRPPKPASTGGKGNEADLTSVHAEVVITNFILHEPVLHEDS